MFVLIRHFQIVLYVYQLWTRYVPK